uniref:EGF domain-specific O-linked N-acetylglucosamine transferase n=1 Tax=Chromulina nebulosa TaxID=96789 RepID=A0A7S0SZ26_9STRA
MKSNNDIDNQLYNLNSPNKLIVNSSIFESDCESRYGISLAEKWRNNEELWCKSNAIEINSQLNCYPYHQKHKQLDGRGPDMFCIANNFVIDFSKVIGKVPSSKQPLGSQYLSFHKGSLSGECKMTNKYKEHLFMPHQSLQMNSFEENYHIDSNIERYETPLYLMARDEDCENLFHSTADFMNAYLVISALQIDPKDLQVMLFDLHPDGPYIDLIKNAFSPNHPVIRHSHFQNKKILFNKIVFHLESPAGLIFPKVSRPGPLQCYSTSLFQNYRKFILKAFNLWDVSPPPIPTITLSLRKRTDKKNVGRILQNEDEIVSVLNQGNLIKVQVIDGGKMSFTDQIKLIRHTNILIGVHGAGLMMIMFAAEEAILIEMHPSYRQDRHFRHAARMTGKIYMPLRTLTRETCQGSSDNVVIPVQEFKQTVDGAIRIARSFDDGLSECGLNCPYEILALDNKLLPFYGNKDKKVSPVNTAFPC